MASAKGDSWLSCAGGWLGSAGGTTGPPRSQSPIGQGCGHAVGDDAAAQSLDDHWCLRCVQLTTLGETLCPSCKNNLIVPFKSSFHIPPYLALRHFASAWRHGGEDVVAETTADRETRTARAAQAAAGRLAFGLGSGDRSGGDSLVGDGGSSGGGVGSVVGSGGVARFSGVAVAGRAAAGGDDGSRPAAVCGGSGSGGVRLERWCASGGSGGDVSRLRRRFSGVVDVSVRGRPGRRRRFGRQHLRRQHLRRWRRVVAAARSAAARVAARRVAAARATFGSGD